VDRLAQLPPAASGDVEVLAFDIEAENGAGVFEKVGYDAADALSGPGRGEGQDVVSDPVSRIEIRDPLVVRLQHVGRHTRADLAQVLLYIGPN
jgi:hypothetical protein